MFLNLFSGLFTSDLPHFTSWPSSPDTKDYRMYKLSAYVYLGVCIIYCVYLILQYEGAVVIRV